MSEYFEDVRKLAVEIAHLEVAKNVKEVGADNRGPEIDVYLKNAHALSHKAADDKDGLGWCGMFVYYCFSQAAKRVGKVLPFSDGNLWSGQKLEKWALSNMEQVVNTCPILPGDIYVMNKYHIGMAVGSIGNEDIFDTIDGNQSSFEKGKKSLRKRTRHFADMRLFIRI